MFPLSTKAGGVTTAFPDTCQTPQPLGTVPVPYPCMGQTMLADKTSTRVKIENSAVVLAGSVIARTNGDEAGVAGGLVNGLFGDRATYQNGSIKVQVEGSQPAAVLLSVVTHNGANPNAPLGAQVAPSQVKVTVAF